MKIEKGIPLPPRSTSVYPWRELAVGDSFLCVDRTMNAINAAAWNMAKRSGMKFTLRIEGKAVRVWRIR